ncbi:MAG: DUF1015 family protein [Rhodospirillales bacterium]
MNGVTTETLVAPFAALRPTRETAQGVAARPYDVLSRAEAVAGAAGRPLSFLHVSRAEIDLPEDTDPHAPAVYLQAAEALRGMERAGALVREDRPVYYAYRMTAADGHVQTGIAAAGSIAAYRINRIRRHEHTRPDKELDRTRQIEAVGAQTGPVLTVHPPDAGLAAVLGAATTASPLADAVTDDGTRHQTWPIDSAEAIAAVTRSFEAMPAIYIADGHHRSAAAARVAETRPSTAPGGDRFLLVSFPADEVRILAYNRIVRDLGERTPAVFVAQLHDRFVVAPEDGPVLPSARGEFGAYLDGRWIRLICRDAPSGPPDDRLDVSRLNRLILSPVLSINDTRTDPRIDFVGGGRGIDDLVRRVDAGEAAVAFVLHPTSLAELMAVADAGLVMPPKSTWFEPKLADGLLSLTLD